MSKHKPEKITASFPDLKPLMGKAKAKRVKNKGYREIHQQLAYVEHCSLLKELDELRVKVKSLMKKEAAFQDRSARNISFWKLENPYLKLEIRRLRAKSKQLENELGRYQKKVPISFPGT